MAATAAGLLLVSLVALASGGSPWHSGGRQDVPVGVVNAVAAAAGALVVGSLLLVWMGTPSVVKRRRRRRRLGARDPEGLGASLSAAGRAAAIVGGAIGLFLLLVEPTGNLDSKTGADIVALLARLAAKRGSTIVVATHDPALAELAPRRLSLRDGIVTDSAAEPVAESV